MENQSYYEVHYGVADREGNIDLFVQSHSDDNYESLVRTAQDYVKNELPQKLYKAFFYQNGVRIGAYVRAELFDLLKSTTSKCPSNSITPKKMSSSPLTLE